MLEDAQAGGNNVITLDFLMQQQNNEAITDFPMGDKPDKKKKKKKNKDEHPS